MIMEMIPMRNSSGMLLGYLRDCLVASFFFVSIYKLAVPWINYATRYSNKSRNTKLREFLFRDSIGTNSDTVSLSRSR